MSEPVTRSIEIGAPVSRVMEVLTDLDKPDRWANEVRAAEIRDRDARGRPSRVTVNFGALGLTSTATYDVSFTETSVTMTCVDAGLVRESTVVYSARDLGDGRTHLDMSSTMEVSVPGIPRWGLNRAMRSSADKNLESIRKDAEG